MSLQSFTIFLLRGSSLIHHWSDKSKFLFLSCYLQPAPERCVSFILQVTGNLGMQFAGAAGKSTNSLLEDRSCWTVWTATGVLLLFDAMLVLHKLSYQVVLPLVWGCPHGQKAFYFFFFALPAMHIKFIYVPIGRMLSCPSVCPGSLIVLRYNMT